VDLKAKLLAFHLPEGTVDVPGVGQVRVRGLSRAEVLDFDDASQSAREARILAQGMVDPALTEGEAAAWRTTSVPDETNSVIQKIMELSGLMKGVAKEVYKEFEADSDLEFHVLPGEGTGNDGLPDAGGDA